MNQSYMAPALSEAEKERLERVYVDLMSLSTCQVPSVRAAARTAVSFVAQALNGQGLAFELYTGTWKD